MVGCCAECANLDKSRKEYSEDNYCYIYGCNHVRRGHCVGWVKTDSDLTLQGCSFFQEIKENEQLSMF